MAFSIGSRRDFENIPVYFLRFWNSIFSKNQWNLYLPMQFCKIKFKEVKVIQNEV
jgi:hypothetical protein